jgi:hypothetical protein
VIRPVALFVLVLRLVLMVMFTSAVTIVFVAVVTFLLKLAVRVLALFLAAQAGDGVLGMRGHGVLA